MPERPLIPVFPFSDARMPTHAALFAALLGLFHLAPQMADPVLRLSGLGAGLALGVGLFVRPKRLGRQSQAIALILGGLALILGSLSPPNLALLGSLLALAGLFRVWLTETKIWRASLLGGVAVYVYFLVSLHWVGEVGADSPESYNFMSVLLSLGAMTITPLWWACSFGAACALTRLLRLDPFRAAGALAFCFVLGAQGLERVSNIGVSPISKALLDTPAAALLSLTGTHGASGLLILLGALLGAAQTRTALRLLGALSALLFTANLVTSSSEPLPDSGPLIFIAGLAGFEHDPGAGEAKARSLVAEGTRSGATLIILPEGVFAADLLTDAAARQEIARLLRPGVRLLTGFYSIQHGEVQNSAAVIEPQGEALEPRHKTYLAPYGEYAPFHARLLGIQPFLHEGGLRPGDGLGLTLLEGLTPFAVLICYEAALPMAVARETQGAAWFANLSSEGAFGTTIGPDMLLAYARMRALESGVPMLRSVANGWSGAIGPDGAVLSAFRGSGGQTVRLPEPRPTISRRHGDALLALQRALLALWLLSGGGWRRRP